MRPDLAPEYFRPLAAEETFSFRCHPGVACFTECCRELDLTLTPYDVLRLSKHLILTPSAFLDQYAIVEEPKESGFPLVYLGMVDDDRVSCPFVGAAGCLVYPDRPGACRTYPLGRGAFLTPEGERQEMHVLLREPHCQGFSENAQQNIPAWQQDQELAAYNAINDELLTVLQHPRLMDGEQPRGPEKEIFLLLYHLDALRQQLINGSLALPFPLADRERQAAVNDNLALLRLGIRWLRHVLAER